MFRKIFTAVFVLMMVVLLTGVSQAQTTKKSGVKYPSFSVTPLIGVQFPLGNINNIYSPSWNAGVDLNLRLNRETAFYLGASYLAMPRKTDYLPAGPDASYIIIQAGPRYMFGGPQVKAMFFIEGGICAYIFSEKEYTVAGTIPGAASTVIPSKSSTNFGVNAGIGVLLPLGSAVDFVVKTKLHYVMGNGTSNTFLVANAGLNFMF
ncbi:MAG: hypothetical protein NTV87_16940 [Ignavibacteriae bacterium]|nr:hypothetical protein [Ignavibacteriota bacterium]